MKNYALVFVFFALITTLSLTSCSGTAPNVSGAVPKPLQTIEEAAEDIIDYAPSGNWDKISADVTDMEDAWQQYESQAGSDGASQDLQDAMTAALEQLQVASQAKDAAATMQASNDVSAAVINLFALYSPKIPADIGRLDVLERQVILDVAALDYDAASATFNTIKSTWEKVKPAVMEHNGEDVIAEFEASLATQESALSAQDDAALTNEAKLALELVDSLEDVFR